MSKRHIEADFSMKEQIEAWRTIKAFLDKAKKEYEASIEEAKVTCQILEEMIANDLHRQGANSISIRKAPNIPVLIAGTTYISQQTRSRIEDREVFFDYVIENNARDLLFGRVSEEGVKVYLEDHKGPPPGVVSEITERLCFRKAS